MSRCFTSFRGGNPRHVAFADYHKQGGSLVERALPLIASSFLQTLRVCCHISVSLTFIHKRPQVF